MSGEKDDTLDPRPRLLRTMGGVLARLAVEMGLLSRGEAKKGIAALETAISGGESRSIDAILVEGGVISRESAERVLARQAETTTVCEKCFRVFGTEGRVPGTRLRCKCGETLFVNAERGTRNAEREATADVAVQFRDPRSELRVEEAVVAELVRSRGIPAPLALPGVREEIEGIWKERREALRRELGVALARRRSRAAGRGRDDGS